MNKSSLYECYFYGLYMDPDILTGIGVSPKSVRNAVLKEFKLNLNGIAKVIPSTGNEVWGTLINLTESEISSLYSGEVTRQYQPEKVMVTTQDGEHIRAVCYNAPESPEGEINGDYLARLIDSARKLSLPEEYIKVLEHMYETNTSK